MFIYTCTSTSNALEILLLFTLCAPACAEVVGAVVSVLIIWVLTGVLVYEAIQRCIHQNYDINPDIMLITACAGVFVNVL